MVSEKQIKNVLKKVGTSLKFFNFQTKENDSNQKINYEKANQSFWNENDSGFLFLCNLDLGLEALGITVVLWIPFRGIGLLVVLWTTVWCYTKQPTF